MEKPNYKTMMTHRVSPVLIVLLAKILADKMGDHTLTQDERLEPGKVLSDGHAYYVAPNMYQEAEAMKQKNYA